MSDATGFQLSKVQNSLSGFVSINNNLKYYRKLNIVVRSDVDQLNDDVVRIISGGGSGHEPSHIGYIGEGMLTASVCGEIFASPSVNNILNAITTVGRPGASILLIVTNYTGDRLNFGLAGEIAKTRFGYRVETVLVDDDCSIDNVRKSVGKRGLAGTILIHKIAGAMAANRCNLSEIYEFCSKILVNERLATVGFTFHDDGNSIKDIEIGRGIHGEPGTLKLSDEPDFEKIIEIILEKLKKKIPHRPNRVNKPEILVMFNNLGGTSAFTMSTFAHMFLKMARLYYDISLTLEGTFTTSFNQEGISVTALSLEEDKQLILKYLKQTVKISANVPFNIQRDMAAPDDHPIVRHDTEFSLEDVSYDKRLFEVKYDEVGMEAAKKCLLMIADILQKSETLLNKMDGECGDGDTGTLTSGAAKAIIQALNGDKINFMYPAIMLHDLSEILRNNMGGTLGAILCIFLEGAAEVYVFNGDVSDLGQLQLWQLSLRFGVQAIKRYGLAEIGDRTMLDALQSGLNVLERDMSDTSTTILEIIDDFATACEEGADATKDMVPKSGRAAYMFSEGQEFKATCNDPGAQVVAIIARSIYEALKSVFKKHNIK